MPTKLLQAWAWIKLNAVLLAVAFAICAGATAFAYFKGRDHGADSCEARYSKRDAAQHREVIDYLVKIDAQNAALDKKWAAENKAENSSVSEEIKTIYKTVEKIVEVPVQVEGPCRIDYNGVARVLDGSVGAAFGDRTRS